MVLHLAVWLHCWVISGLNAIKLTYCAPVSMGWALAALYRLLQTAQQVIPDPIPTATCGQTPRKRFRTALQCTNYIRVH